MSAPPRSFPLRDLPARMARWFIPPAVVARGREAVIRSQAILVAVAAALLMGPINAVLDMRLGVPVMGALSLAFVGLAAAVPFVLRYTGSLELAGNLTVAALFFDLLLPGLLTLGRGPAAVFLFMVPLFAVVLCNRRSALVWSLLAVIATILLAGLAGSSLSALVVLPSDSPGRFHRVGLVALLVCGACILTYDLIKAAALGDLERANTAIRESREQFRRLIEACPDAVFVTREHRIRFANSRAIELLGAASEADLLGRRSDEFLVATGEELARYASGSEMDFRADGVRLLIRRLSGERVPVEATASRTLFEGVPATLAIVRDRRAEERNLVRLRLLGTVVEQAHEGVLVVDAGGVVRYVNEGYARARGLSVEAMIGRSVTELPRDDASRNFMRSLTERLKRSGGVFVGRFSFPGPEGMRHWDIRVFPVQTDDPRGPASVALLRDVSRESELEERARQSQKMEAVGQLAGGIAHDFNNHLTVILGHAEELRASLAPTAQEREAVEAIVEAADRSASLTQQLLAFARRQAVDVHVLDLSAAIRGMHDMLRRLLPERIHLALALESGLPAVLADRGQIEQVVLNLVLNARDAIAGGGRIEIAARSGPLPEGLRNPAEKRPPGAWAILKVSDDGSGIDPEVRLRIFDPFFTTKPPGRGTGLGLAMVHGIVHQSGGTIDVASTPGVGTAMTVYLPAADLEELDLEPEAEMHLASPPAPGIVLLVEDDASVRRLARRALEGAGYRVLEAADGEQALRLAANALLDLVVSDIVMPGMSGLELADRIAESHPGVPILFVSGYADDAVENRRARSAGRELLGKPFRPQQLVERARQMLAAARSFA